MVSKAQIGEVALDIHTDILPIIKHKAEKKSVHIQVNGKIEWELVER